jgi:hypothetical protein
VVRLARRVAAISRRSLFLICAALLAIPLVVLAARWLAGDMSIQVWYIVWYADYLLDSVPQDFYWVFLVVISVVLASLSLIRRRTRRPSEGQHQRAGPTPVRELAGLIRDTADGYYYRWSLARELSRLIVEVVDGGRLAPADLRREWYGQQRPGVPAPMQAYVKEAIWGTYVTPANVASQLRHAVSRQRTASPLDIDPASVVQFIEEQLEVVDDRRRL